MIIGKFTQNLTPLKDFLTQVTHAKFLGLVDNKLKFDAHSEQIIFKLR